MRNGLNIAAMSELVAELKHTDIEAHLFYKVCSQLNPELKIGIDVLTLEAGSTRAARDFSIAMKDKYQDNLPGHMDFALGALGCCVLVTFVYGCSTKGISFDSVKAKSRIDFENGKPSIKYEVYVECDGETEDVVFISNMVSKFSPNHRVFQDENQIVFYLSGNDGTEELLVNTATLNMLARQNLQSSKAEAELMWLHGTQYIMNLVTAKNDNYPFMVDQPKQYIGYDYGPNPQEILLSAILHEIKNNMPSNENGEIQASGHVNLKGISGVDLEVDPKMDQIKISIFANKLSCADIKANILEALSRSTLIPVIVFPNQIQIGIYKNNEVINQYTSPQV